MFINIDILSLFTRSLDLADISALSKTRKEINIATKKLYNTPLYWKSRLNNIYGVPLDNQDIIDWSCLCKRIELKGFGKTFVDYCSIKNCKAEIDLLLSDPRLYDDVKKINCPEGDNYNMPLSYACKAGNLYACQKIILSNNEQPSHYDMDDAAEYGHKDIVEYLLAEGHKEKQLKM
jgi:hypothetical protein